MNSKNAITVYCASSVTIDEAYFEAARELGAEIARRGVTLITGAGSMGLMGAVNDAAIAAGGTTIGVIPQFMVDRDWHHKGLSKLEITDSMHSRKEMMAELSQAAIALPGGIGTFEELLEIITWRQLGLYDGNIVILNVEGYYDNLLAMLDTAISQLFMKADHRQLWSVTNNVAEAVDMALSTNNNKSFSAKF
ncbi:MAG: TIGR00730 family Rossman fold protein [Muribaculaceae bacterium]|nr:TIGR00730 family Rossman fold protein [Muribaculaceae bacterium]